MQRQRSFFRLATALSCACAGVSATAAPTVVLSIVADQSTIMPGNGQPFELFLGLDSIYGAPAISAGNIVFWGARGEPQGQQGIYALRYGVLEKIADHNTPVPGGRIILNQFDGMPSISGGNITFSGGGEVFATGPQPVWPAGLVDIGAGTVPRISGLNVTFVNANDTAIYASLPHASTHPGPVVMPTPVKIADTSTPVPGGTAPFYDLYGPDISGKTIVFRGTNPGVGWGYYASNGGESIVKVADPNTPGSGRTLDQLYHAPVYDGHYLAFPSVDSNPGGTENALYINELPQNLTNIPPPILVADNTDQVPGSTTKFDGFEWVAVDHGRVVFRARNSQNVGYAGVYTNAAGPIIKLMEINDIIGGKRVSEFHFATRGFSGNQAVFAVVFTDGSQAVVLATIHTDQCPLTATQWANRSGKWPAPELIVGNETYTQKELLELMAASGSDPSLVLAKQLIAAKLNAVNLTDTRRAQATMSKADGELAGFFGKLPYHIKLDSALGQSMLSQAAALGKFNLGISLDGCIVNRK